MTLPFQDARTLADDAKLRLVEMVARYFWGNEI
jgi:hypothetical protein